MQIHNTPAPISMDNRSQDAGNIQTAAGFASIISKLLPNQWVGVDFTNSGKLKAYASYYNAFNGQGVRLTVRRSTDPAYTWIIMRTR